MLDVDIIQFLEKYGMLVYGVAIFFGGHWGLKYFNFFKNTSHNFLLFATVFAVAFFAMEWMAGTINVTDLFKYLLTFTVVTSVYENIAMYFPFLKPKKPKEE